MFYEATVPGLILNPGTGGGGEIDCWDLIKKINCLAEIARDILLLCLGWCHAKVLKISPNGLKYCIFYFWRDFMDVRDLKIHTPEILLGQSAWHFWCTGISPNILPGQAPSLQRLPNAIPGIKSPVSLNLSDVNTMLDDSSIPTWKIGCWSFLKFCHLIKMQRTSAASSKLMEPISYFDPTYGLISIVSTQCLLSL